jgi:hypothetical protein
MLYALRLLMQISDPFMFKSTITTGFDNFILFKIENITSNYPAIFMLLIVNTYRNFIKVFLVVISSHPHIADVHFQRYLVPGVQLKIKFNLHHVCTIAIMLIKNYT